MEPKQAGEDSLRGNHQETRLTPAQMFAMIELFKQDVLTENIQFQTVPDVETLSVTATLVMIGRILAINAMRGVPALRAVPIEAISPVENGNFLKSLKPVAIIPSHSEFSEVDIREFLELSKEEQELILNENGKFELYLQKFLLSLASQSDHFT